MNFSNFPAAILVVVAIFLLLLAILLLVLWLWCGGGSIVFPGLGIVVSSSGFVTFLLFLCIVLITVAGTLKH